MNNFGTGRNYSRMAMSLAGVELSSVGGIYRAYQKPTPKVKVEVNTAVDFSELEKRAAGTIYYTTKVKPGKRRGENRKQYRERLRTSGFL